MDYKSIYYPESRFGGFTNVDGTIAFYIRVNSLLDTASVLLDVGCGRGCYVHDPVRVRRQLRMFRGRCKSVIGIDIDEAAREHPGLDEFRLIQGGHWPVEDECIDLCLCDYVLEHVEHPEAFLSECRRVLKPGGYLCLRTANVWRYIGLISRLMPNRFHATLLNLAQDGRRKEDIFFTWYRCNTRGRVSHLLRKHGFEHCVYQFEAEPLYLSFSRFFYSLGVIHQRYAPSVLKPAIFAFAVKKAQA